MKPQDLFFIVVSIILLLQKRAVVFVIAGMLCLLLAIPLFSRWVFFTAERLTWYAATFFLIAILFCLFDRDGAKQR